MQPTDHTAPSDNVQRTDRNVVLRSKFAVPMHAVLNEWSRS
jgi:hypothetical protein